MKQMQSASQRGSAWLRSVARCVSASRALPRLCFYTVSLGSAGLADIHLGAYRVSYSLPRWGADCIACKVNLAGASSVVS